MIYLKTICIWLFVYYSWDIAPKIFAASYISIPGVSYDQSRQHIKKQRHYFANKDPSSQSYSFSSSHVWMWELDYKESWMPKNWCFWTVENCWRRHLRVPWTARRSNQPILKEISPEYSLEGLMLKLKLQYFGHPPDVKNQLIGKDPDAGKNWRQEKKGITGWDGWMASSTQWTWVWAAPRVGDGQGGLACCNSWGRKESDMTERLNWTELNCIN